MGLSTSLSALAIGIAFLIGLYFCGTYTHRDVTEGFDIFASDDCPNLLIQNGPSVELHNTRKARIPVVNPVYFRTLEDYAQFLRWQRHYKIRCPVLHFQEGFSTQGDLTHRLTAGPFTAKAGLPSHHTGGAETEYGGRGSNAIVRKKAGKKTGKRVPHGKTVGVDTASKKEAFFSERRSPLYGTRPITRVGARFMNPRDRYRLGAEAAQMSGGLGIPHRPLYDASHDDPPYNQAMFAGFDPNNQNIGTYTPLDKIFHLEIPPYTNPMDADWKGTTYTATAVKNRAYRSDDVLSRRAGGQ